MTGQNQTPDEPPISVGEAIKKLWSWGKRIASLEARVTALEESLDEPFRCQMCGAKMSAFKTGGNSVGPHGALQFWTCKACGQTDERWVKAR
jgi:transcription elongation factor Elf1